MHRDCTTTGTTPAAACEETRARLIRYRHVMTPEDGAVFDAALARPSPTVTPAMADAIRLYRSRVVYAD